ncbi:hypothetical protein, partial [Elioraea sp.]|uniref:hypothetical protein n=1 Tax=Elioraea sp. TaxID=2185103 RepID=UPI0025BAC2D3
LPALLRALGFSLRPAPGGPGAGGPGAGGPGQDGAVLLHARRRAVRPASAVQSPQPEGPFAALAALRAKA